MLAAELLVFAFDVLLPSVNDVINAFGNDHAIGEHFFGKTSDLIIAFLSVHGEVIFGVCHNYSLPALHLSARPHLRADPKYRAKGLVLPIVDITNEQRGKMPAQISTLTSFFLEEDDQIQIKIGQLNEETWTVEIGEILYGSFYTFMVFYAKSEKQAQNFRKLWKEKVEA